MSLFGEFSLSQLKSNLFPRRKSTAERLIDEIERESDRARELQRLLEVTRKLAETKNICCDLEREIEAEVERARQASKPVKPGPKVYKVREW